MPVNEEIKIGLSKGSFTTKDNSVECADTIELLPSRKWRNDVDFHTDFNTATTCIKEDTPHHLLLTFEAKARESLLIVLSPSPKFTFKSTTIVLGGSGNTETEILYKKQSKRTAGRVVREDKWVRYWVCYENGKVSVGVGDVPGEQRIQSMQIPPVTRSKDKSATKAEEPAIMQKDTTEEAEKMAEETTEDTPIEHIAYSAVGFRTAGVEDRQAPSPLLIRSIRLAPAPQQLLERLATTDSTEDAEMIILGEDEVDSLPATEKHAILLLQEHKEAIVKAKARAAKFGVPYVEPALTASLNWSDARRLRANPTSKNSFATGMDIASPEEMEKRNKRKERFGVETSVTNEGDWLPVEEAWDKLELCGMQRMDPPNELWLDKPVENEPFAMEPATFAKEKIHIFSMDWSSFKQIRTSDIVKHFIDFGPTYVEWLGDLSCNVLFEDEHSASRALEGMSQELPLGKEPDLGQMGWRFGKTYLRKAANDKYGRKGTTARLLMRIATSSDVLQERPSSWPKPPAGFSKTKVLGPNSDLPKSEKKRKQKREAPSAEEMLNGALSSSRGGFSLEELEAERESKRAKST